MSQEKGYITIDDECGKISISQEVIANIATMACMEVEGVAGMAAAEGESRGVVITTGPEEYYTLSVHILVKMGAEVAVVAAQAQQGIKNAVESTAGLTIREVNVFVAGITNK